MVRETFAGVRGNDQVAPIVLKKSLSRIPD